jgi:hypothetical protein
MRNLFLSNKLNLQVRQLNLKEYYAIAATDTVSGKAIPVHSNYFLDAINPVAGSLPYVFLQ